MEKRIEKHLYERKRQTATGEWSRVFYVRLKDWQGMRRVWPAGNTLKTARVKRAEYEHRNAMKEHFDKDKWQGMTLARWGNAYLTTYAKRKKSLRDDARHVRHLCRILGEHLLLSHITRAHVEQFKQARKTEMFQGRFVAEATIDRSLEVLRHMLRLAEEEGVIASTPRVTLYRPDNARARTLTEEEYQRLLAVASVRLRRLIVCGYETGMRAGEIGALTWEKVDLKTGFLRLGAEDTKTNEKRAIPLSSVLRAVLEEIRREQRDGKVRAITGHVFTWQGRPLGRQGWYRSWIRTCQKAALEGVHFHDLRHTFVTRKVKEGHDYKRIMAITGHKTFATFQRYNNPSEEDIQSVVKVAG